MTLPAKTLAELLVTLSLVWVVIAATVDSPEQGQRTLAGINGRNGT